MKTSPIAVLSALTLAAAVTAACSSGGTAAQCNPCGGASEGGAVAVIPGHDTNPDGLEYPNPAGGYGHTARVGRTPGSVIANLKFYGYPNGDKSKGLQIIALADYYDPCARRLKLLHLSVAGVWCNPCNQETDALVAAKSLIAADGAVLLQALSDGPVQGMGATQQDLDYWVSRHSVNFTEMLDPGPTQFGGFFKASAIPWNADVDPRTMEIIDSATGLSWV